MEFERLQEVIADSLGCDKEEVTMEASFRDDLGADSLDAVELILAVEEASGVEIPDEEAGKMKTVSDIVEYLKAKA